MGWGWCWEKVSEWENILEALLTCLGKLPSFQAHISTEANPTLLVAHGEMKQPRGRKFLMRHGNALKTFHDSACFETRLSAIYCARKSWKSKMPREAVGTINDWTKNSLPADLNELFYFHPGSSVAENSRFDKLNFSSFGKPSWKLKASDVVKLRLEGIRCLLW